MKTLAIVALVYALNAAPAVVIALFHQPAGLTAADMVPAPGRQP